MDIKSIDTTGYDIPAVKAGLRKHHALGFTLDDLRFIEGFGVNSLKEGLMDCLGNEYSNPTFEQLADIAPRLVSLKITGVGAGKEHKLKAALMLTAEHGFHQFACGGNPVPRNLSEFVDLALTMLPEQHRRLLTAWIVQGMTGIEVAARFGLASRQAVDIRLKVQIRPLVMDRIGWFGREYIKPLRSLMNLCGGICHLDSLKEVYGDLDPSKIVLAAWLTEEKGHAAISLWRDSFLIAQPESIFDSQISQLRQAIRRNQNSDGTIESASIRNILLQDFGIFMKPDQVESFMTAAFNVEPDSDGIFDIRSLQYRGEKIVTYLAQAGRAMRCDELAGPMYEIVNGKAPASEDDLKGYARRASAILERSEKAIQWAQQHYIHLDNLPIRKEQVSELQALAGSLILAKDEASSIKDITKKLKPSLPWISDYDPYLIKNLVCLDSRIRKLRKYLVAPAEMTYDTTRSMLLDETKELLESEDRVFSTNDVFEQFEDRGLNFSIYSINVALARNSFSVNLGNGTVLATKHVGIGAPAIEGLQTMIFDAISNSQVRIASTYQLTEAHKDDDAVAALIRKHGDAAADVLWGILRLDAARFATGAWNSVAIRISPDDETRVVSSEIALLALKRLSAAFTSDLMAEIESWWGRKVAVASLDATLNKLRNDQRVMRFPFGIYYPADVDKELLFERLRPYKAKIDKILKDGLVSDLSDPQWQIADEFFQAVGDYSLAAPSQGICNR